MTFSECQKAERYYEANKASISGALGKTKMIGKYLDILTDGY